MPIYSIQGPDGNTYSIEGPAGASRADVIQAIQRQMAQQRAQEVAAAPQVAPPPAAPSTQRTIGEAILDIPAAGLSGLGGLLQFPGQLVKLVPGLSGLGEVLEKPGELVAGAGDYLKSEGLKARQALQSKAISDAEKDGILSQFATAITSTIKDPALLTTFVAEQVPLLLGPLGAAKVAQKIGAKSIESAGAGLTGKAAEEAVRVAAQRVNKTAATAAYGTGSAMQAADVSSDAYDQAYKQAIEQGLPEDEALRVAANAGRVAGAGAGVVSLLAQRLPGAMAIEKRLAGVPGTQGRVASGFGEALGESLEEGGGQLFKNLGLRQVNPEQPLLEGVGGAAGLGALGGGLLGTALGRKAEEPRFEGQQEGESDRQFAARLQQEIAAGMRPPAPPAPPPAEPSKVVLPGDQQLFTLAAQPNGYGMLENLKQRLIENASIPEDQKKPVIENIRSIQERMNIETVDRLRPMGQPPAPLLPTDEEAQKKATEMDLGKLGTIVENMGKSIPAYQAVLADPEALKKQAKKEKLSVEETQSRYQQHIEYINSVLPVYTQVFQQRKQQQQQTKEVEKAQEIANLTPEQQAIRSQAESMIKELAESGVPEFVASASGFQNVYNNNNFKTEKDIEFLKSKVESYRKLKQSAGAAKPVDEISLEFFNKDYPDDLARIQEASKDPRLADLFTRINDVMGRGAKAINALGMSWSGVDARSPLDIQEVKRSVGALGGGVGQLTKIKQAIDKNYDRPTNDPAKLERAITEIEVDIETANQRIAKVQALAPAAAPAAPPTPPVQEKVKKIEGPKPKGMPVRAKELPQPAAPVSERQKQIAEMQKDVGRAERQRNAIINKSQSLWSVLVGKLNEQEVNDINPERRFKVLRAKKGVKAGESISTFVANGDMDPWLPPDRRLGMTAYDEYDNTEYIKDLLRGGRENYITHDTKMDVEKLFGSISELDRAIRELLTIEEANAAINTAFNEQRRTAEETGPTAAEVEDRGVAPEPILDEEGRIVRKSLAKVTQGVPPGKFRELERRAKAAPEPKAEKPKAEEPKPEEPKAEEPKPTISPEIQKKIETLGRVLQKNLAKFGLKGIDLNLEQGMADEGSFSGQLIRIALDAQDPLGILRHESIHALKEANFFTDKQWATLERMADQQWIDQYLKGQEVDYEGQVMSRYDAYMKEYAGNMALIREEAIADAFRNFSKKQPAGLMGTLTTRMKNFFKAVKSAFNSQGFESAEDIFGKIEEGKLEAAAPTKAQEPEERKSLRAPTTEAFKNWTRDLPIISPEDTSKYRGGAAVFQVFHGTTHDDIIEFRPDIGNAEGSLGRGPYFSTSIEDVNENYAGMGPDITNRISRESESVADAFNDDSFYATEVLEEYLADSGIDTEVTDENFEELKNQYGEKAIDYAATKAIKGKSEGLVMPVWVRLEKPFDMRGTNGTMFYLEYPVDANGETNFEANPTGTAVELAEAIQEVASQYNADVSDLIDYVYSEGLDGVSAKDVFERAKKSAGDLYDDNGEMISSGQFVQDVARELGFDGIIQDAYDEFGLRRGLGGIRLPGMKGVTRGTLHIMPFNSVQVKSVTGNVGTYGEVKDIRKSLRATETKAFDDWFKGSKVVDNNGKPRVMYHGTAVDFDEFKPGSYVTADPEYAAMFGDRILPVYVSASKIKTILDEDFRMLAGKPREIKKYLDSGFDALASDSGSGDLIILKPERIKSAIGNVGAYNIHDRNILKSLRSSDDRFNSKEIDEMRAPGYKSKEKLIEMPISDFLQLAEEGYDERKMRDARKLLADGKQFSSIPFLGVEMADENNPSIYRAVGHEGRHRARALEELGYKTMPVILKTDFIRWSEQNDPNKFDYREVWPSRLEAQKGAANPYFSIPFPVNREESEKPYGETERKSLRTPNDNIVDLTQRRAEQLVAEENERTKDLNKQEQSLQRQEDLRFLAEEASPFFKSVVNQVQLAREVYDLAPMLQTDIRPALYKYDRMWKNYMTAVYGDDSNMYGSPFEDMIQNSAFYAASNLRPEIKDAEEFKSEISAYLKEVTDYANSLSNRSPQQKAFKRELLDVLNRPVVRAKFSLRSRPFVDPATEARIDATIIAAPRESLVDRMIDAISPKTFSRLREEFIVTYNELAEVDKRVAAQIRAAGGKEQLADERAESAALLSDQAAAVASSALGAHNRKGGIPVYRNGIVTVDTSGDNEGPVVIFAPLASTGDPKTFRDYQFWATVNRSKKYILNPGQTRYVEQVFEKDDIDRAEQLRRDYAAQGIDFRDIQSRWNKYNNGLVKLMRDTGGISDRAARDFMQHADYFPFYRQVNEEDMAGPKAFSTIAGTKPPKAAKGGEAPMGDFFETVIRNTQAAITLAMKNVAAQRATSQALRINEVVRLSESPQIVQTGPTTWDVMDSQYIDTINAADQAAADAAAQKKFGPSVTVNASNRPGEWNVFKAVKIGDVDAADAQEARQLAYDNHKYRPDITVYKVLENGQPVYYRASDIKFINAIKALNMSDLPFIGLLSAPSNLLRTLVTKDPGYMLVNQMRDSLSAWQTSGVKMTPFIDSARQFAKSIAKTSPEMEALFNAGVIGGYEYAHGQRESGKFLEKEIRRKAGVKSVTEKITTPFASLWGALERGTQVSDGATRAEVYKRVLAETGNEAEAIWQAAEVLNFYRHGRNPIIRVLTAAVPFLNSRIQGLDVLYRAGMRPAFDKMSTDEQRKRMKTFWVRGMTMFATTFMYWLLTHDDDEYKKQEQETRDNYWLIPSLGIKIATPFEVGVIFKVLPERLFQSLAGNDTAKDTMDSLKRQLESTLMFSIIPQAVAPYIEVTRNFSSFTQRPIIGQGLENVAPRFQVAPGTSSFAQAVANTLQIETTADSSAFTKGLSKTLEISPVKLDHLIKGYTGTLGQYAVEVFDAIYNLNADVPKPSKRFEQLPVIKRLALDPNARGNVTAYYDLKNAVDEVVRTSNLLERTMNYDAYAPYLRANIGLLANKQYISALEKSMKEFRETKILIRNSKMDSNAKEKAILAIEQMENQLTSNIQQVKVAANR